MWKYLLFADNAAFVYVKKLQTTLSQFSSECSDLGLIFTVKKLKIKEKILCGHLISIKAHRISKQNWYNLAQMLLKTHHYTHKLLAKLNISELYGILFVSMQEFGITNLQAFT